MFNINQPLRLVFRMKSNKFFVHFLNIAEVHHRNDIQGGPQQKGVSYFLSKSNPRECLSTSLHGINRTNTEKRVILIFVYEFGVKRLKFKLRVRAYDYVFCSKFNYLFSFFKGVNYAYFCLPYVRKSIKLCYR